MISRSQQHADLHCQDTFVLNTTEFSLLLSVLLFLFFYDPRATFPESPSRVGHFQRKGAAASLSQVQIDNHATSLRCFLCFFTERSSMSTFAVIQEFQGKQTNKTKQNRKIKRKKSLSGSLVTFHKCCTCRVLLHARPVRPAASSVCARFSFFHEQHRFKRSIALTLERRIASHFFFPPNFWQFFHKDLLQIK